jgi:SAM-dependent methyltransferase
VTESFAVNENSEVYYSGTYWNNFVAVRRRINERISGDPTQQWYEHFAKSTKRTFERALILNCGNGWVERELVEHGLIAEGVGIDYSETLLDQARSEAGEAGLPLTYHQADINTGPLPAGSFDLVVNHAAAHHIAAIDRVFREVCRVLPSDGWFVSFDYVGPHRNQYRLDAWEEAWKLNRQLPASLRQELTYPPLPVMLVVDPTEAIHSELILGMFDRYFTASQFTPLGGAIAYPLLTHNDRMFNASDDVQRSKWIDQILIADDLYLAEHPESTLFAYFAGTPKKSVLERTKQLATWEAEEVERERLAKENGGEYYDRGPLAMALIELEGQRAENVAALARLDQLQSELDDIRSSFLYTRTTRLLGSRWTRRIRGNRVVAGIERRVRGWRGKTTT